jgi:hypothetical protein
MTESELGDPPTGASYEMLERPNLWQAARVLAAPARWYRYFNQTEHWVPNGKPPVQIADMELAWRLNCVRYLERNAARYAALYADGCSAEELVFGLTHPDVSDWVEDSVTGHLWNEGNRAKRDPLGWIKTTKLYRALAADLPSKGAPLRKLANKAKHWGGCEKRLFKKGTCTCAQLAAEARWHKELATQALAEASMPE